METVRMVSAIELLLGSVVWIMLMVRWGLLQRLLPSFLRQRIHDEILGRLKVSAPHLQSTFDGVSYDGGNSTSR